MNLLTLAEHTVDEALLPEHPVVFDIGCRWFSFSQAIRDLRPSARVVCFDPDPLVGQDPKARAFEYHQNGLVGTNPGARVLKRYQDGVSDFIEGLACEHYTKAHENFSGDSVNVSVLTIQDAMAAAGVDHLDVVKLDCECSEFDILSHWPGPIATQISVEFHDWADASRWDGKFFDALFAGPLRDYRIVQHEWHGSYAHMDSLLVLRSTMGAE